MVEYFVLMASLAIAASLATTNLGTETRDLFARLMPEREEVSQPSDPVAPSGPSLPGPNFEIILDPRALEGVRGEFWSFDFRTVARLVDAGDLTVDDLVWDDEDFNFWMELDETTGIVSGTPPSISSDWLIIGASANGARTTRRYDITFLAPPPPALVAIADGPRHTCAIDDRDQLWCWGDRATGRLGDGLTSGNVRRPQRVQGMNDVVQVAVAKESPFIGTTCVVRRNGSVWCWGDGSRGQIGNGQALNRSTPTQVLGLPMAARSVHLGTATVCAILVDSSAWCWGRNDTGEVGIGVRGADVLSPQRVTALGSDVVQIAMSNDWNCAIRSGGDLWCWGRNRRGQFGNGEFGANWSQAVHPAPIATGVTGLQQIATGEEHMCGLFAGGEVRCWGDNTYGQIGNGQVLDGSNVWSPAGIVFQPTTVIGAEAGVTQITAGWRTSCAIRQGQARCWGGAGNVFAMWHGAGPEPGGGTYALKLQATPVFGITTPVTAISALNYGCLITEGEGYCWGANTAGQVGDNTTTQRTVPTLVDLVP